MGAFDLGRFLWPDLFEQRAPQCALEVDWGHPYADRLIYCLDPVSGIDLVTGRRGAVTDSGTVEPAIGRYGRGFRGASGIRRVTNPGDALRINSGPVTHLLLADIASIDAPWGGLFAVADGSGNGSFSLQRYDASGNLALYRNANTGHIFNGAATAIIGRPHCIIASSADNAEGAAGNLYIDGVPFASAASTGSPSTSAGAGIQVVYFGERSGSSSYGADAMLGWHMAWAKDLSREAKVSLSANPFQILRPAGSASIFALFSSASNALSASASGVATAAGTATLAAQVALSAVGVSSATGSAAGSINVPLSATGVAVAGGAATASAAVTISAAALAQAAGSAGLSAQVLLAAAGAAQASGNAVLAVQLSALAAGAAQASGSANLSGGAPGMLSANGSAVADGQAVLSVSVNLAAAGNAVASGTANGSANAPGGLSAAGAAQADGWASWSVLTTLTAAGFVQAMGAGQLAISVPLSAAGQASASGSATAALLGQVRHFRLTAGAPQRVTRAHCAAQRTTRLKHEAIHA